MLLKRCSKCREFKSLEYFHKNKNSKDGRHWQCKQCKAKYCKKYYQEHKKEIAQQGRKYQQEHKEERKKYRQEHGKKRNEREKNKYNTDPLYRLNDLMSKAIRRVKNPSIKNGQPWKQLVPYTLIQLRKHLKRTLPKGYSWKDFMQGKLHIDHIIPKTIFTYEKPEDLDFQICWGLDNLRLLPSGENLRKHTKLIKPFQKHFAIEVKLRDKIHHS